MSAGNGPADAGGSGLLRGGSGGSLSSRSYGSLVRSGLSPVRRRHVEHRIQPGETLQGLALKYGVTTEQIKRVNRLYTNDSIFLKKSLTIPVLSHSDAHTGATEADDDVDEGVCLGTDVLRTDKVVTASPSRAAGELTARDFFSRLDSFINESKQATARRWPDAEKRLAHLEEVCCSGTSERPRSLSGKRQRPEPPAAAVPVTTTKLTLKLREREDDIFEL
ncbi:lysM and putative peptidoglycan-binding domain-containing protein 1 [Syngnathoides biaculeatus]|uniref:lysM and putative peptidoglycan-binding domain-containing protein 1 n=1 Tax=Syngnathoides biaculeatus TaxID=300417 RepID=UPI002ADE6B50|nr:lysM and putative peptidoglycan-binding domain-containing protein 1 [Syngnathoides biaculeatus]XP_061676064.1 lysM and putative peptidoglycan-binding domain-containing protein 1 [Syngnathoides biaculeatus]